MNGFDIVFWVLLSGVLYTYLAYPVLIWMLTSIKNFFVNNKSQENIFFEPEVALIIPAYNELPFLAEKVDNCLALDYPKSKLRIIFVTDGSNDGSEKWLEKQDGLEVFHEPERKGKAAAINRVMTLLTEPVTIFCDANTYLNKAAVYQIVKHYTDKKVGGVAGEKRVIKNGGTASSAGEGLYWKYESFVKSLDSKFYTTIGAAGELFSIKTSLFEPLPEDTLLDDFVMSMRLAERGYIIKYEPKAVSSELAALNIKEELKRKLRIAVGSFQAIPRLKGALNPFTNFRLTFQYFSRRLMRWIWAPIALVVLLPLNVYLCQPNGLIYPYLLIAQIAFHSIAILGWMFKSKSVTQGWVFVPFYFNFMHLAFWLGFFKFLFGKQSVKWEKAERLGETSSVN